MGCLARHMDRYGPGQRDDGAGRCFRMGQLEGVGQPDHCREPVAFRGRFRGGAQTYGVDACDGHAHELDGR
jgi:hypothetical protein